MTPSGFSSRFTSRGRFGAANQSARRARELKAFVKTNRSHEVARFGTIHVFPDRLVRLPTFAGGLATLDVEPDMRPIHDVTAQVDAEGGVSSRTTLTRALTVGDGWGKKIDTRKTWLTITGPDWQWTVQVPAHEAAQARQFVAELNTFVRQSRR